MSCWAVRDSFTICCAALCLALACSTPMAARPDAGRAADASNVGPDASTDAPDLPADAPPDRASNTPDLLRAEAVGGQGDERQRGGVPKGFRVDNHTDHTVYITGTSPVTCAQDGPAGPAECSFFNLRCGVRCSTETAPHSCCNLCVVPAPSLYAIAPGESRLVAWDGTLRTKVTDRCTDCWCEGESPVPANVPFQASIAVYTDFKCDSGDCAPDAGGVITSAVPLGSATTHTVVFAVPYLGDEVVFDLVATAAPDAGAPDVRKALDGMDSPAIAPDTADAPPDLLIPRDTVDAPQATDVPTDGFPTRFFGVLGTTFTIASDATPPDASLGSDGACIPPATIAHYQLIFSGDGTQVRIVRTDGEELVYQSTLKTGTDEHLVYEITNAFAGGQLEIRIVDSTSIAQLVLFGSGRPILWCIQSPMVRR